jgi:hypothetical protein
MNGEPIRLLDNSSIRDELRQRLAREATVKPQYDFERGLARLRAAIASGAADSGSGPMSEPPASRLSITNYAVKGSVWKLAGVVGLAATAAIVGLHAWGPATHVGRLDAALVAPAPAPAVQNGSPAQGFPARDDPGKSPTGDEADNLAQIKIALATDPRSALALVDDGNVRFAAGTLREEREASAIDALRALGRSVEAQSRARGFLEIYPNSPLSERMRQNAKR